MTGFRPIYLIPIGLALWAMIIYLGLLSEEVAVWQFLNGG
jgi:hypothetical protein